MSKAEGHLRLLRRVLEAQQPALLSLVDGMGERRLSDAEREVLRGEIATALVNEGLDLHDEPTAYGLDLEGIIDWLGHQ